MKKLVRVKSILRAVKAIRSQNEMTLKMLEQLEEALEFIGPNERIAVIMPPDPGWVGRPICRLMRLEKAPKASIKDV